MLTGLHDDTNIKIIEGVSPTLLLTEGAHHSSKKKTRHLSILVIPSLSEDRQL